MAILGQLPDFLSAAGQRRLCRRRWLTLLALLAYTAGLVAPAAAQVVTREYQLKAVLLYNLTQFVEWPPAAYETNDSPLVIGILGHDPFGIILDEVVRDERSGNRQIVVKRFANVDEVKNCQVLYISANLRKDFGPILGVLRDRPILTVADADGFIRNGGMVRLAQTSDNKIRLKINLDSAKARNLTMSAKLLRVAEILRPDED